MPLLSIPPGKQNRKKKPNKKEDQPAMPGNNPGILYGTWWHEFVQNIPWQQPITAWQ